MKGQLCGYRRTRTGRTLNSVTVGVICVIEIAIGAVGLLETAWDSQGPQWRSGA